MSRLSAPFGLSERIRKPDTDLDATATGTILLIALMLVSLVGSRFVYAPGLSVDFSAGSAAPVAPLNLPAAAPGVRLAGARTSETLIVPAPILALKQDDMAIWDGRIMKISGEAGKPSELEKSFAAKPPAAGETLLLKIDRSVSMKTFFNIVGLAKKAGYASVRIAGEEAPPPPAP